MCKETKNHFFQQKKKKNRRKIIQKKNSVPKNIFLVIKIKVDNFFMFTHKQQQKKSIRKCFSFACN